MPKRSSKQPDANQIAAQIVEAATQPPKQNLPKKNPAAVTLGRLGGAKGGLARAAKLSAKQRREIAEKAARARWDKAGKQKPA